MATSQNAFVFRWTTEHRAAMVEALDRAGVVEVRASYLLEDMLEAGMATADAGVLSGPVGCRGVLTEAGRAFAEEGRAAHEQLVTDLGAAYHPHTC